MAKLHKNAKTAVYLRVSTKQQEVDSQKLAIQEYLDGNNITVNMWMIDKISGVNMRRPAFRDLQRQVFNGSVNHVIMYSLDRFARNMVDGLVELDKWQKQKCKITFVADQLELDFGTWMGDVMLKMMVTVRLAFAEAERDRMVQRRKDGISAMRIKCREARALLLDGMRIEDIAIKFKVSPDRASRMSQPNGVWGSKKGKTFRSKISMSRLKELIELGLSNTDIMAIFKCCRSTFGRKMVELKQSGWKSKVDKEKKQPPDVVS